MTQKYSVFQAFFSGVARKYLTQSSKDWFKKEEVKVLDTGGFVPSAGNSRSSPCSLVVLRSGAQSYGDSWLGMSTKLRNKSPKLLSEVRRRTSLTYCKCLLVLGKWKGLLGVTTYINIDCVGENEECVGWWNGRHCNKSSLRRQMVVKKITSEYVCVL